MAKSLTRNLAPWLCVSTEPQINTMEQWVRHFFSAPMSPNLPILRRIQTSWNYLRCWRRTTSQNSFATTRYRPVESNIFSVDSNIGLARNRDLHKWPLSGFAGVLMVFKSSRRSVCMVRSIINTRCPSVWLTRLGRYLPMHVTEGYQVHNPTRLMQSIFSCFVEFAVPHAKLSTWW